MGQLKKLQYGFGGMNQDISKSKRDPRFYYEANNIRITATENDSLGVASVENGNTEEISLPVGQIITHVNSINEYIIIFSSNYTTKGAGEDQVDGIWTYNTDTSTLKNIFQDDLNFTDAVIESEVYVENDDIIKIYWVDGVNQLRFINIITPVKLKEFLDIVPLYSISQPKLESISYGGLSTAGRVQYAYNLIIKNGQQTKISPLSQLISLTKQDGSGGDVNEVVGQINNIIVENVDTRYDIIRLYAIKYTSYNTTPTVSLIAEENISGADYTFRFSDDGSIIYNISLSEFLFLGGTPFIPKTINNYKNILLIGNIKENYFDLNQGLDLDDDDYFDTRAYKFPSNDPIPREGLKTVINNQGDTINSGDLIKMFTDPVTGVIRPVLNTTEERVPIDHDCINERQTSTTIYETEVNVGTADATLLSESSLEYIFDVLPILRESSYRYKMKLSVKAASVGYEVTVPFFVRVKDGISNVAQSLLLALNSEEFQTDQYSLTASSVTLGGVKFFLRDEVSGENVELLTEPESLGDVYTGLTITESVTQSYPITPALYKYDSNVYGASGEDLEIEVLQQETDGKFVLKDNETYRLAMEFYNGYGEFSQPRWITDLKMPQGNLEGNHNTLKITIKPTGITKLQNQGIVGWRMLRVERTDSNKTILDQGVVSSSVYQIYDNTTIKDELIEPGTYITPKETTVDISFKNSAIKLPSPLFRTKNLISNYIVDQLGLVNDAVVQSTKTSIINGLNNDYILNDNSLIMNKETVNNLKYDATRIQPYGEVFSTNEGNSSSDNTGNLHASLTIQNNELLQLFSPETILLDREIKGINNVSVVGTLNNTNNTSWGKKFDTTNQQIIEELTNYTGLSLYPIDTNNGYDLGKKRLTLSGEKDLNKTYFHQNGIIGPTGDSVTYIEYQYGREFTLLSTEDTSLNFKTEDSFIYTPIYASRGERNLKYHPIKYNFYNDLKTIVVDKNERDTKKLFDGLPEEDYSKLLNSINSVGSNSYIFALEDETPLETVINDVNSSAEALIVEFRRTLTNQYGGNTYEARSRNSYIRIGDYVPVDPGITEYTIDRPGDTFVGTFRFARILPNLSKIYSANFTSICEIVEVPVESSIDLSARNDLSTKGWNSIFHPQHEEYHKYNRVYSQEPIANKTTANPYTIDHVEVLSTRINATKVKTSGEIIDSWTDILVNEELKLQGKYGNLNKIISKNNQIYAFQDTGIAQLQVQPRIQQVTSDGLGVELGSGQILYNYEYISTSSGSCNKLAIFESPSSIYYLDLINKTFNRISSNGLEGLSDRYGFHTFFNNNLDYSLKNSKNILGGYDRINNDAYIVKRGSFAVSFNEQSNSFTSFYDIDQVTHFLRASTGFYTCNGTNTLWKHSNGNKATYYGTTYDSFITLFCSPKNMYGEVIFNNLTLNTEYLDSNGDDVFYSESDYTIPFKSILVWNDYQETDEETLVYPTNIARKFRTWNLFIPRDKTNIFSRIRGKYAFIKLKIHNSLNNTLVLHDVVLSYIDNNK